MGDLTFSVVICTHNRADYLGDALRSVLLQDFPGDRYETLVVDNASTDDTRNVVSAFEGMNGRIMHYLYDAEPGLSHARNTGAQVATGKIIAYIDDDAIAQPDWLAQLEQVFLESPVQTAIVGGGVDLLWENGARPKWLPVEVEPYLASTAHLGQLPRELQPNSYPVGCNFVIRSETLASVGYFLTPLGRRGNQLQSNEEVEICHRVWATGDKILYAPNARVLHRVPEYRATKKYILRRAYWQGRSDAIMQHQSWSRAMAGKAVIAGSRDALVTLSQLIKSEFRGTQHDKFLTLFQLASRIGAVRQNLSLWASKRNDTT
jgi:glycosyltransferase involved in cell wall biosynthesis